MNCFKGVFEHVTVTRANIYLLKVTIRTVEKRCKKIHSKLTKRTPERRQ